VSHPEMEEVIFEEESFEPSIVEDAL